MSAFKLIGIRPHKDCGDKFLKLLEPGRLYQFYNEFEFYTDDGKFDGVNGEITYYNSINPTPDNLYKIGGLNVNISAVVGKNGTGKSTLIELLLYSKYLIGTSFKDGNTGKTMLPKYSDLRNKELQEVQETYNNRTENINKYRDFISKNLKRISKSPIRKKFFMERIFRYIDEIEGLSEERLNERNHLRYLKAESLLSSEESLTYRCSLYYLTNDCVYEMTFNDQIELFEITTDTKTKITDIDLTKHFFYSTILNYSHHSLNSNHIGYWINSLFHKNDGYKTPAVINPMRDSGNFNINKEIELSKSRLLVNSLIIQLNNLNQPVSISDKQNIDSIRIKRKDNSFFKKSVSLNWDNSSLTYNIQGHPVGVNTISEILNTNGLESFVIFGYNGKSVKILEDLMNYLINKVHRIQKNYPEYIDKVKSIGINDADQIAEDKSTIKKLNKDYSHVSFKYHRSIFFFKKLVNEGLDDFFSEEESKISLIEYLKKVNFLDENLNILEEDLFQIFLRVPPPIFEVDFNLTKSTILATESCKFEELSSGEQQSIHTINTFIYHLNNAYSVHKASIGKRQKYNFFNAVFDEIELYYHPDLQRKFINDLLNTLKNNSHLYQSTLISDINIIFSTHSPFILSDIPAQNILQLEYGLSDITQDNKEYSIPVVSKCQTFGANIFDLLTDRFYLNDGSIGAFAREKIQLVIDNLLDISDEDYAEPKIILKKQEIKGIVDIIAEPFFKEKLLKMYFKKFDKENRKKQLIDELKELES